MVCFILCHYCVHFNALSRFSVARGRIQVIITKRSELEGRLISFAWIKVLSLASAFMLAFCRNCLDAKMELFLREGIWNNICVGSVLLLTD